MPDERAELLIKIVKCRLRLQERSWAWDDPEGIALRAELDELKKQLLEPDK